MRKARIIMLSAGWLCVGAVAVSIALYVSRPPVPDAKLRQVKPGMSEEAVRALLGPPTCIYSATNLPEWNLPGTNIWQQWAYERNTPWGNARVDVFITNGAVSFTGGDRDL